MTFPESTEVPLETEPCGGEPIGSEPVVRNAAVLAPFMLVALTVAVFYVLPSDPQIVAGLATLLLIVIGAELLAAAALFRRSLQARALPRLSNFSPASIGKVSKRYCSL
jgi:hypothetical protein